MIFKNKFFLLLLSLLLATGGLYADQNNYEPDSIPGMVKIKATERKAPAGWAVMERHLMDTLERTVPIYLENLTYRGGTMKKHTQADDDYECYISWPLFYILGGDEKILDQSIQQFHAVTRQWTYELKGGIYNEMFAHSDMLHMTEPYVGFQHFGLADPFIPENVERARRFAGVYMNEYPEAQNYDYQYKIIRSIQTGSKGPVDHSDDWYVLAYRFATLYPIVKDLEWEWFNDPKRKEEIQKLYDEIVTPCDTPLNLMITGLVTNAYLYTGEEKYKKWVLDYVDAWMDRIEENNGILPDNIGRTGKIGEYRNGQWWGGFFGWTSRYSIECIFRALITATECAHLLSGDDRYLNLLRSQVDILLDNSIIRDGCLLVPYKYGPEGWQDFRPLDVYILGHLWHASLSPEDWERIERIRKGTKYAGLPNSTTSGKRPQPGSELWKPDTTKIIDWNTVYSNLKRSDNTLNQSAYLSYLGGTNPDWPEKILAADFEHVRINLDDEIRFEWQEIYDNNPVIVDGLLQATMGCPDICFNGGLVRAQVLYFDIDRARPGLPLDVAALVKKLESNRTVLELVNTSAFDTRRLIIQAGAYGEHEVTEVKFKEQIKDKEGKTTFIEKVIPVNKKFFAVELPPATTIELEMGVKRFVNSPSFAFPWHKELYQK